MYVSGTEKPQRVTLAVCARVRPDQANWEVDVNTGQFIQWQDLFVLVDDGSFPAAHYTTLEGMIREQAKQYPTGVGILCILPPDARPPPDDVKRVVKSTLIRLAPMISCLGYVIEGTGFRGVTARATLVGMKIFSSRPYPIYVEISLSQALGKMAMHMANRQAISIEVVAKLISETRLTWKTPVPSMRTKDNEVSLK
jgi:hypothetical protein